MTRKKTLKDFTGDDLLHELAARFADQQYRPGMTMSQMELSVWEANGMENPSALGALNALLARMPLEAPTGKRCPKCNKRVAVKAKDRTRSLRTMAGVLTLTRNYHSCDACQLGFYPLDRALELREEGELTAEMEKRVLDFALNEVYGECAALAAALPHACLGQPLPPRRLSRRCALRGRRPAGVAGRAEANAADDARCARRRGGWQHVAHSRARTLEGSEGGVIYRHDARRRRPSPARRATSPSSMGWENSGPSSKTRCGSSAPKSCTRCSGLVTAP